MTQSRLVNGNVYKAQTCAVPALFHSTKMLLYILGVALLATLTIAQRPSNDCRNCEVLLNIALHHFNNNITDKAALQRQLLLECNQLAPQEGQDGRAHCIAMVNDTMKMDKIFQDLQHGMRPFETCIDLMECPMFSTTHRPNGERKRFRVGRVMHQKLIQT